MRAAFDYSNTDGKGYSAGYAGNYVFNPVAQKYLFLTSPVSPSDGILTPAAQAYRQTVTAIPAFRKLTPAGPTPFLRNNFYGAHAEISYTTGAGTLTVVPAWRYSSINYLATNGFNFRQEEKDEQFSLEARFDGERIGIFDYMVGAFTRTRRSRRISRSASPTR